MTVFDRYLEQAKDFTRKLVRAETGTRRWATVTSVDPILITYDGPAPQGIISPVVLGAPVTLGDRVRAHTIHDKTYITRANPTPLTLDDLWVPGYPWRMAAGQATISVSNSTGATVDISYPSGRFTVAPRIQVTKASGGGAKYVPYTTNRTASGCRIGVYAGDGTAGTQTVVLDWTAVQMTPTSAGG